MPLLWVDLGLIRTEVKQILQYKIRLHGQETKWGSGKNIYKCDQNLLPLTVSLDSVQNSHVTSIKKIVYH